MAVLVMLCHKNMHKVVLTLCCIESVVMSGVYLTLLNSNYNFYGQSLDSRVLNQIAIDDEDKFYRIFANYLEIAPFIPNLNLNQSLHYDYHSMQTYDTTYESNLDEFLTAYGFDTHIMDINDMVVMRMLGMKYYLVTDESDLPQDYEFEYYTNCYHWSVYKYMDYRPVGFTYTEFTNDISEVKSDNSWNDVLYISEENYDISDGIVSGESTNFTVTQYEDDNNIGGIISNEGKQMMFFSIPYNEGWNVYDYGVKVETYKVQGGFIGVVLQPGEHFIELKYQPQGFKIGIICSAVGGLVFLGIVYVELIRKKKSY